MDLKNRAHSHVLAPDTKSTAPKHGSVGTFQKLGARGGKSMLKGQFSGRKKVHFVTSIAINNVRSYDLPLFAVFAQLIDVNGSAPGPTFPAPDTKMTLVCSPQTPSNYHYPYHYHYHYH